MGVFVEPEFPEGAQQVRMDLDVLDAESLLRALRRYGEGDVAAEALTDRLDAAVDAGGARVMLEVDEHEFRDLYDAVEFEYAQREKHHVVQMDDLLNVIVAMGRTQAIDAPGHSL